MTAAVPRPPLGYSSMAVSAEEIVLQLTISNKCGQAFRWRGIDVYEYEEDSALHFTPDTKHSPYIKQNNVGNETTDVKTEPSSSRNGTFSKITEWSLCLDDRVVFVRQDTARGYLYYRTLLGDNAGGSKTYAMNSALIEEETRLWLRDYLNLDFPLDDKYNEWSKKDPVFARFAKRFSGARILRQDPWECLCSFICSSNNNIARIGQMVQNLCTHYSEPIASITYPSPPLEASSENIAPLTIQYHPFPSADRLAGSDVEETLRILAFGYRARFIQDTARLALQKADETTKGSGSVSGYLDSLRNMTYAEAREELRQFPGVGPKVADCILLMSMDQPASIPVDRHVFQFAERWYRIRTKGGLKGYEHVAEAFRNLWGEYAGWACSVLFMADLRSFQTYNLEASHSNGKNDPGMDGNNKEAYTDIDTDIHDTDDDKKSISLSAYEHEATESARTLRWKRRVDTAPSRIDKSFAPTKKARVVSTHGIKEE